MHRKLALALPILLLAARGAARAQDLETIPNASGSPDERWNVHFQFTTITQHHPAFPALYSGQNSMSPEAETDTTVTATLVLGARLWKGAALYVNPEMSGGSGLSSTFGIAGFPNGEAFRVGSTTPKIYLGRLMLSQTFALEGGTEKVEDDANQLGGTQPVRRWVVTVGKFGIADFFDGNPYSHDPRQQFMNWADWTGGSWDYSADTRGYTWGFVIERYDGDWAARFAGSTEPLVANGEQFDTDLLHAYSLTGEFERQWKAAPGSGAARLLLFYNRANMGNYRQAILEAGTGPPDIVSTRRVGRTKWGFVVNVNQALGPAWGLFLRGSWNDGENEAWAYAEIERSVSIGAMWNGPFRSRPADQAGIALIGNGLSGPHREYLARGGYGFMIGDGALAYGLEGIAEVYYQAAITAHIFLAGDYQFVLNPAYNRDRGPVNVLGLRFHVQF